MSTTLTLPRPPIPTIKSDYPQAETYFITVCTHERECLFGEVVDGQMKLNDVGLLVAEEWQKCFDACSDMDLHHWVIMPNHIHGIVATADPETEESSDPSNIESDPSRLSSGDYESSHFLRTWINSFKEVAASRINSLRKLPHQPLWQQEFDTHCIPHRFAFHTYHQYINTNPHAWHWDKLHPDSPAQP